MKDGMISRSDDKVMNEWGDLECLEKPFTSMIHVTCMTCNIVLYGVLTPLSANSALTEIAVGSYVCSQTAGHD